MKEGIGRENYFDKKNVKESERRIWTRARCGNTYNLGRYEKNGEKREVDGGKKENTWRVLEDQLRKGSMGLEIMEFLKQEERKLQSEYMESSRC